MFDRRTSHGPEVPAGRGRRGGERGRTSGISQSCECSYDLCQLLRLAVPSDRGRKRLSLLIDRA